MFSIGFDSYGLYEYKELMLKQVLWSGAGLEPKLTVIEKRVETFRLID